MSRYKNDKRTFVLRSVLMSGQLWQTHARCLQERPGERFIVVVCDMHDTWGRAMATWDGSSTEEQRRRFDIWTFAFDLQVWKERRRKLMGAEDTFEGEGVSEAIHYAIVSGQVPLIGSVMPTRRHAS